MFATKKHRVFVTDPMGDKKVTELPGIGEAHGRRLEEKGVDKAHKVLSQFLRLGKDQQVFMAWLKDTCGANSRQQHDCWYCLNEWCDFNP